MASARLEIKTLTSTLIPYDMDAPNMSNIWAYLDEFLSYEIHNSFFIKATSNKAYIRDIWDGRDHLFNTKKGTFPTGLLPYVLEAITQYNISIETVDLRPEYLKLTSLPLSSELDIRQYQVDAVDQCIQHKRGIIWARPRSGKTIIEIMLVSKLNIFPVLSICQSIDIANQTVAKFKQFLPDVKVGLIGNGQCDIQQVTVTTIQSLAAAYNVKEKFPKNQIECTPSQNKQSAIQKLVETAKVVWVDECHHSASNTHKYILQSKTYAAEYILGCSGTPFREDNTDLLIEGLLGPIIYEIDYSKLIKEGYLVQPTIHIVNIPKNIHFDTNCQYATIYKHAISDNKYRNNIIAKIARDLIKRKKTCMILVNKINHGKELAKLLPSAEFSYSNTKDREQLWTRLKTRVLSCLITTLGDEGVDIPSLDATIIAAGGKSAIKVFQRLRCMTPYPGKNHAIIVDFKDPYKYLRKHSKKREALYNSEDSFIINYKNAPDET